MSAAFDRLVGFSLSSGTKREIILFRLVDVICEKMAESLEEGAQQATPGTANLHENQQKSQNAPPCTC